MAIITDQSLEARILNSNILIIDDEEAMASMLAEILIEEKYANVRFITDPRKSLETYEEFQPDLIILDLNMPRMDGFDVMEKIKTVEKGAYLSILVLTGESDQEIRLRALQAGAKDFLNKPINLAETLVRIHNLLEVRILHKDSQNQNKILERHVFERTKQLREAIAELNQAHYEAKQAYIETIYRLSLATEYKDEDTAAHVRRMSLYSSVMARALGLDDETADMLLYASPMHDVGKIGIPDAILLKKGPLTPEEWEIMKTHTTIGSKILSGSQAPILKMAESIALNHHECWDGSGYPRGIKGDAIPIEGRIVMVVDIYDALRSKRPYKKPFDHETSLRIMLKGDGRVRPQQFDPNIVELLEQLAPEFQKIYEEHPL
ncbi:MAG: response regulator [Candidatus Omnitrophota bacterium]|nr:response regulator [Candidatus Omnitrophota bacterium]